MNASLQHGPTDLCGSHSGDLSPDASGRRPGRSGANDQHDESTDSQGLGGQGEAAMNQ